MTPKLISPPQPATTNEAGAFMAALYQARSDKGRRAEAKIARQRHLELFGCLPADNCPPSLVVMRVYYRLLVAQSHGFDKLNPRVAARAKTVLKMGNTYAGLDDDLAMVARVSDTWQQDEPETATTQNTKGVIAMKDNQTETRGGANRIKWFDHPATDVARWFGANGYTTKECIEVAAKMGIDIKPSTICNQVPAGRRGDRGKPAELTKEQHHQVDVILGRKLPPAEVESIANATGIKPKHIKKAPGKAQAGIKKVKPAPKPLSKPKPKVIKKAKPKAKK